MDPLTKYRDAVMSVLQVWEQRPGPESSLQFEAVFDRDRDRYLLVTVGWDGHHHVHSTLAHIEMIGDKVWVQHDQTERGLAPDLVAAGVPADRIVLGFKSPARRAVTGYAVS
jgi:XisI protein